MFYIINVLKKYFVPKYVSLLFFRCKDLLIKKENTVQSLKVLNIIHIYEMKTR